VAVAVAVAVSDVGDSRKFKRERLSGERL